MPGGRPSKIDQVVERRRDGTEVTAAEKILELTRTVWAPWDVVAASAGISPATLHSWRKAGGAARAKAARRERLTPTERRLAAFLEDLEKAEADAVAARLGLIQKAGQGGYEQRKVVTSTRQVMGKDGTVVTLTDTTTTVTYAKPEWQAEAWQLERRRSADFGRRLAVEGVADGAPIRTQEERAGDLAQALEAYQRGVADGRAREQEASTNGMWPAARTEEATDG